MHPKVDDAVVSKLISDEIIKQCNNTTLQNTKNMLHNTAVVKELKIEIGKLKLKTRNLRDQIDETNGMKSRLDNVEQKVTAKEKQLHLM